jgi:hypothetical protein
MFGLNIALAGNEALIHIDSPSPRNVEIQVDQEGNLEIQLSFGFSDDGFPADLSTFKAMLYHKGISRDITADFGFEHTEAPTTATAKIKPIEFGRHRLVVSVESKPYDERRGEPLTHSDTDRTAFIVNQYTETEPDIGVKTP